MDGWFGNLVEAFMMKFFLPLFFGAFMLAVVGGLIGGAVYLVHSYVHRGEAPTWGSPHKLCVSSHLETTYVMSGKVLVPITSSYCDSYSADFYIDLGDQTYILKPASKL